MKNLRKILREAIKLDVEKGDVILTGRFKNKRRIVKSIGTDRFGQPTINGKSILKLKIEKHMPKNKMSAKTRKEMKEIKQLRGTIRRLILEGPVKDSFDEAWYNVDEERGEFPLDPDVAGTMHRDQLTSSFSTGAVPDAWSNSATAEEIEELFKNKRDLKRLWNEVIDANDLRSFWEGPKMKYFHSLSYYGSPSHGTDKMQTDQTDDADLQDLTAYGFFQEYNKTGNKDEMSTYGIYNDEHWIPRQQQKFGVIISGRVTLATMADAFTESRSKASPKDIATHASSGMPKRIMPDNDKVASLLFEEEDIKHFGSIGECIIDNWSIDAIVCSPRMEFELKNSARILSMQYKVPLLTPKDLGKKL